MKTRASTAETQAFAGTANNSARHNDTLSYFRDTVVPANLRDIQVTLMQQQELKFDWKRALFQEKK